MKTKKLLPTKAQRLTYIDWDYNSIETAPDLTGLRHRAFISGDGTTLHPDVVFLLRCPTMLETRMGNIKDGIHYKLIKSFCEDIGIEDYYATYLIKYELAKGREIFPLEASTALSYVREEITVLDPFITVLVGDEVHNTMFPNLSYEEARGKLIIGTRGLYYTIPDVLLARRNMNAYADVADDLFLMADVLNTL